LTGLLFDAGEDVRLETQGGASTREIGPGGAVDVHPQELPLPEVADARPLEVGLVITPVGVEEPGANPVAARRTGGVQVDQARSRAATIATPAAAPWSTAIDRSRRGRPTRASAGCARVLDRSIVCPPGNGWTG
jgi:hypothetical protein